MEVQASDENRERVCFTVGPLAACSGTAGVFGRAGVKKWRVRRRYVIVTTKPNDLEQE